jgi:enolase-phosphatase E1
MIDGRPTSLRAAGIRCVLLDIEGTTTPIAFVYDVLFPYARAAVHAFLTTASPRDAEVEQIVDALRAEHASDDARGEMPPPWDDVPLHYVWWLMDRDRKATPLKALQGRIWEAGYASGALKGAVYPDVLPAFRRWTSGGVSLGIFSSGSVLAQQLLFAHSTAGDLTPFLSWYFDTAVGSKRDQRSYQAISTQIAIASDHMLFISDIAAELDAARDAGFQTLHAIRSDATTSTTIHSSHPNITTFDSIDV